MTDTRPRAWWEYVDDATALPAPKIEDVERIDTGLLDAKGRRIERRPRLGFLMTRKDEYGQ